MEIVIIWLAAFFTAILTFFSGFGLGTILAPVFAIFFPIDIAIALTGVVHFSNNLFKIALIGRNTDKAVLLRFGICHPSFVCRSMVITKNHCSAYHCRIRVMGQNIRNYSRKTDHCFAVNHFLHP